MKSQVSVKCACESCGQHLEYDSANGGEVIQCPTCASKVLLPKARGLHPSLWKFVLIVAPVCVLVTTLCQMAPLKRRLHGVTQRVDGTSGTALELSNTVLSARAVQERRAKRLEEQEFQHRKVAAWATKASYDPSTENRRGYVEACKDLPLSIRDAILTGRLALGMTSEQAKVTWGNPDHINRTGGMNGIAEQWVYGDSTCVYFENGMLTSWQQSVRP